MLKVSLEARGSAEVSLILASAHGPYDPQTPWTKKISAESVGSGLLLRLVLGYPQTLNPKS